MGPIYLVRLPSGALIGQPAPPISGEYRLVCDSRCAENECLSDDLDRLADRETHKTAIFCIAALTALALAMLELGPI